jgi:hypothetical protein
MGVNGRIYRGPVSYAAASRWTASHFSANCLILAMMSGSAGQRCVALIRHHPHVHAGMAGLHGFDRPGTQDIGVGAVNDQDRHPGKRLELSPHGRDGLVGTYG